jgi:hypothetical protein
MNDMNEQFEERLRQDLASLADRVTGDNLEDKVFHRLQRRTMIRCLTAAGGIAAILILGCWFMFLKPTSLVPPTSFAAIDIDTAIHDAGISTQLLLSAQTLAQTPGGEDLAHENFQYIIDRYPETQAARQAHEQIQNLYNRRTIQ